jgi:hypothetical protein
VAKSTRNPVVIRAKLVLKKTSIPKIARKHGANVQTVYAMFYGRRTGRKTPAAQRAMEEIYRA